MSTRQLRNRMAWTAPARVLLTVSTIALTAALALAASPAAALPVDAALPAGGGPPPGGGPVYSHTVYSDVTIAGSVSPGGLNSTFVPAPCWLEPRFTGDQSWTHGDPRPPYSPSFDADTYYWWFAQQQPSMSYIFGHIPGIRQMINQGFKRYQGKPGWWWVPAWVDSSQGYACGQGLVDTLNLNNAYLDFQPPQTGGPDTPGHTIDGRILADLARAALALPTITLHTNPSAPARPSEVNLPIWAWVTYHGPMRPSDTASVPLPGGGTLSATVATSAPALSLSVSAPGQARVGNNCGTAGSRYAGQANAAPPCGVTFLAPSVSGPYTITATVRWTVTWSDSTGESGPFASPPYPPSVTTRSVAVTVREIQAVNGR